jgi:hypothetical protein
LQIVKHEPPPINVVDLNHRIDNQARLWADEDLIKKEVGEVAKMKPTTLLGAGFCLTTCTSFLFETMA